MLINSVLFGLTLRLLMKGNYDNLDKWRYTLETTVLLLILFNKYTFKLMQKLLGKCIKIASKDGNPTICGFLIHAAVFTLLLRGLMELDI